MTRHTTSPPGRAPESTWTSTYREAEVAQGEPEAEEAQGAEDWVPPKQYCRNRPITVDHRRGVVPTQQRLIG